MHSSISPKASSLNLVEAVPPSRWTSLLLVALIAETKSPTAHRPTTNDSRSNSQLATRAAGTADKFLLRNEYEYEYSQNERYVSSESREYRYVPVEERESLFACVCLCMRITWVLRTRDPGHI
eukprot:scaffold407439_cov41-Prasinocladus_malaysianus.AAC.1